MKPEEHLFQDAAYYWDLEKIYSRFGQGKQKISPHARLGLNSTERLYLRALLCGYSPTEIARKLYKSPKGLEVYLCRTIYRYFKAISDDNKSYNEPVRHSIPHWSETEGYRLRLLSDSLDREKSGKEIQDLVKFTVMNYSNISGTIDIKITIKLPDEWKQKPVD